MKSIVIVKSRVMATGSLRHESRMRRLWIAKELRRASQAERERVPRMVRNMEEFVMAIAMLDVEAWAEQQFRTCELGDERRTRRLVRFAAQAAEKPDASTPRQTEVWADLKAAYRLFDQDEVTFETITAPHQALTREQCSDGLWLILNDTTELNFGCLRKIEGVGRVGSKESRGFFLHSALAVCASSRELTGVAGQALYTRPLPKVKRVSSQARKKQSRRETDVWGRVIDQVGPPPEGVRFLHVCDRGADNFDVYCHLMAQRAGWVIRAAQLKRQVRTEQDEALPLDPLIRRAPCLGTYELAVSANAKQSARTARLEVRAAALAMPRPKAGVSRYARETGLETMAMWAVEAREVSPVPKGTEPLRWVLLTSEQVATFASAWQIIEYYEQRPLIEEYHKCLKTGCQVETRQYQTAGRLAAVIGLTAVLAVRLLQLKHAVRTEPDRPAQRIVPARWIKALRCVLRRPRPVNTVRDFFRALASLGGFLGRKCDGEPGWQTIWRGLDTLLQCLRGMDIKEKKCG